MDEKIRRIYDSVIRGEADIVEQEVQAAMDAGLPPEDILKQGLITAMHKVGDLYDQEEFYVPEMMIAARAMQSGLELLKPSLASAEVQNTGKVVLGTVEGDLHDIGKNLVGMMLEGAGFELLDLGVDVSTARFLEAVREDKPDILAMSALLTTTMSAMKRTIDELEKADLRSQVLVMVGGAPVTAEYASEIGADAYASDASRAIALAKKLVE